MIQDSERGLSSEFAWHSYSFWATNIDSLHVRSLRSNLYSMYCRVRPKYSAQAEDSRLHQNWPLSGFFSAQVTFCCLSLIAAGLAGVFVDWQMSSLLTQSEDEVRRERCLEPESEKVQLWQVNPWYLLKRNNITFWTSDPREEKWFRNRNWQELRQNI